MAENEVAVTDLVSIPVYESLAKTLKSHGITTVFGLVSDDTVCFCAALNSMS